MQDFLSHSGALLIDKHAGVSSFGIIEELQKILAHHFQLRKKDLPKFGHGGSLDPFATGMLTVCMGSGVKLARYFLGAPKIYEGTIRFGETTISGDPDSGVCARSSIIPDNLETLRALALKMTQSPYLQKPPMFSAKKKNGKPLYELARQGIEIEREAKACTLFRFEILSYQAPRAEIRVECSSGTYIRTLAQDFAEALGSVGLLERLHRISSGYFSNKTPAPVSALSHALLAHRNWSELPCWVPFNEMLEGYPRVEATSAEAQALIEGRQEVLGALTKRMVPSKSLGAGHRLGDYLAIYLAPNAESRLVAVAHQENEIWNLERVFP